MLQFAMTRGGSGDAFEREADRTANQVMRMSPPGALNNGYIGGKCSHCGKDEGRVRPVQATSQPDAGVQGAQVPANVRSVLNSSGQPLDASSRSFMESRFGYDFSRVQVHADARANETARTLSAKAFAVGNHLAFGAGHYAPNTHRGRWLLAHELSHVIQQGAAGPAMPNRSTAQLSSIATPQLQPNPDVDFIVRKLTRKEGGKLGDPDQSASEEVSWPLDFSVTSPLDASAEVEVTGGATDDCSAPTLGFLQTVHSQSLEIDYLGQQAQHGSTKRKWTVDLPIRDGEAGSMWYESSQNAKASACGDRVRPGIGDYPTIFSLNKRHVNSKTNEYNHLSSVKRTMGFVTTLVAEEGDTVTPLRYFLWSYQMSGTFTPNYADATVEWPFTWIENSTTLKDVQAVQGGTVPYPLFTSASDVYNDSLTEQVLEKG